MHMSACSFFFPPIGNVVKKIRRGILNALVCISKSTESMIAPQDSTSGLGGFVRFCPMRGLWGWLWAASPKPDITQLCWMGCSLVYLLSCFPAFNIITNFSISAVNFL